jgi:endonuclease/exonuclease/phosphatase family metal-dependent hydrolase
MSRLLALILVAVLSCGPGTAPFASDAGAPPDPALLDAAPHAPAASPLRIGSFNVRRLGLEPGKDLPRVADIIGRHFDLLVVLEVMQTELGGHPGLDALHAELSTRADFELVATETPRPRTASPYAEHYAVLYRPERVRPCAEQPGLEHIADHDGSASGQGADRFLREPAVACFETRGAKRSDFALAVYHARWGSGEPQDIAREVAQLEHAVAALRSLRPGERDLLLLGDFNLAPAEVATVLSAAPRMRGTGSTLGADGEPTANLYDQLWVVDPAATPELAGDAWVLDARGGDAAGYRRAVSDHLPLVALWRTDLGDDD